MRKPISTATLTHSQWQEVKLPIGNLEAQEVLRALGFSMAPARCSGISEGYANIEILGVPEELTAIELQLRQALTDQQLRKEINQRSNRKINEIVEAVIAKVTGK